MGYKVESFNLDHTKVSAPYLRVADKYYGSKGDVVTKFDLRICQPNKSFMHSGEIHTLEHLFAVESRKYFDNIIDFSPMGCRTGFYLTLFGDYNELDVLPNICDIMKNISVRASKIPAVTERECGNYKDHDLYGAKNLAYTWLCGIQHKGWHY